MQVQLLGRNHLLEVLALLLKVGELRLRGRDLIDQGLEIGGRHHFGVELHLLVPAHELYPQVIKEVLL